MYRSSGQSPHPGFGASAKGYAGAARILDAHDLPALTRAHLLECLRGRAVPTPLLAVRLGVHVGHRTWLALAAAAGAAWLVAIVYACTARYAPSLGLACAHVACGSLVGVALALARRAWRAHPGGGIAPGVYLFPFDLVDARTPHMRVLPLVLARDVRVRGSTIEIAWSDSTTYALHVRDADFAAAVRSEIIRTIERVERMSETDDVAGIAAYDAFHELRREGSWAPARPDAARLASPRAARVLGALAVGTVALSCAACGVGSFFLSARANDDARFAAAHARGSQSAYLDYLETGGGRYSAEVERTLLPAAELARAVARSPGVRDTEALTEFLQRYPSSYVSDQARAILASKTPGVYVMFASHFSP